MSAFFTLRTDELNTFFEKRNLQHTLGWNNFHIRGELPCYNNKIVLGLNGCQAFKKCVIYNKLPIKTLTSADKHL